MIRFIPIADAGWLAIPFIIFSIPIVGIVMGVGSTIFKHWLDYRVKVAEIRQRGRGGDPALAQELQSMKSELEVLRDRVNQMAIDNDRLASLTRQAFMAVPPPPPAEALRQRIE